MKYHGLLAALFVLLSYYSLAQNNSKPAAKPKLLSDYIDLRQYGDTIISYYDHTTKEDSILLRSITDAILSGKINAYHDAGFTKKASLYDVESWIKLTTVAMDTLYQIRQEDGAEIIKIVNADFNFFAVYKYALTGYSKYNAATKKNEISIQGLAPAREYTYNNADDTTIIPGTAPFFWVRYSDLKNILAQYNAAYPYNKFASEVKKIDFSPVVTEYYDSGKYIGHEKNGKYSGRGAYYDKGNKYFGEFEQDKLTGKGAFYYVNGDKYVGNMKNGERSGYGTYYESDDSCLWQGIWKDGNMWGKGSLSYPDGTRYDGDFKNSRQSGKGVFTWSNGDRYEGQWEDDVKSGNGIIYYADGDKYTGEWKGNKKCGKGTYVSANGDKYEGEWKDGDQCCKGTYVGANGDKYEGEWKDGDEGGTGTFTWADGDKYEGEWKDGIREGYGTYAVGDKRNKEVTNCPKCVLYKGYWKNSQMSGTGACFDINNNKIYEGRFLDGKPIDPYPVN